MAMVYLSDIIKAHLDLGLALVLLPGRRSAFMFECPECKKRTMVKFHNPDDNRPLRFKPKKLRCKCGYSTITRGFKGTAAMVHA